MNSKQITTLIAGKFKTESLYKINRALLFTTSVLLIISCSKNEDFEITDNESPINAQSLIIYKDIEPDFVSDNLNQSYDLDLNNDHIIDFTLKSELNLINWDYNDPIILPQHLLYLGSKASSANGSISVTPWLPNPLPLDSGKEIFSLAGYTNGESYENWGYFMIGNCGDELSCYSNWEDKSDKYLGLKFYINGKAHYGWVQLDISSATQWVIKDYAYNSTPNKPILAGQKE